jgi:hypothetical protein
MKKILLVPLLLYEKDILRSKDWIVEIDDDMLLRLCTNICTRILRMYIYYVYDVIPRIHT